MSLETLETLWYCVFLIVLMGYIVLDGFDLGVGALHLFVRKDEERRVFLNAIGPVWDGNEVWLVILGGALFAGFPVVYATLLSAFYVPVMVLIAGLIFRAVAIEFRGKLHQGFWRSFWDGIFALGSVVIALGLGLVFGNLIQGLVLDENHEYAGTFADFFTPYTILVALLTLSYVMMHGNLYLVLKTEGALQERLRHWVYRTLLCFIILYVFTTIATLIYMPYMADIFRAHPWFALIALLNVLAIANIPRQTFRRNDGWAFLSSVLAIVCLVVIYALGTFPTIVRAVNDPENLSLTISNSYGSQKTLGVLLIIVAIGIPVALAYLISIYYLFRGKVKLDTHSY